jgi:hypothetical protein
MRRQRVAQPPSEPFEEFRQFVGVIDAKVALIASLDPRFDSFVGQHDSPTFEEPGDRPGIEA